MTRGERGPGRDPDDGGGRRGAEGDAGGSGGASDASEPARLLFPAIRWDPERSEWDAADRLDGFLELGVGGFILFGGPADAVAELVAGLRARSPHPLLIGADLERGAGQQFQGATPLPPAAALASLGDPAVTRAAGEMTGREALALGVDWVYAPVADVDVEAANPIVGTRAFGADPGAAARHVAAWVEGCRSAGAMACAKHFPGHGRTTSDSHLGLPSVNAPPDWLRTELAPFRAAIEAGVDSVMTAHVAFPALDPSGDPATLSRRILQRELRQGLAFDGIVVTDALIMEGVRGARAGGVGSGARADTEWAGAASVAGAAVRAVAAGCDALLYPPDAGAVAAALDAARGGALPEHRVVEAVGRVRAAAERMERERPRAAGPGTATTGSVGTPASRARALEWGRRAVHVVRGAPSVSRTLDLVTVDDDVGGPYPPPSRSALPATLARAGLNAIEVDEPGRPAVIAVYADIRGFKGRPGLSGAAASAVRRAVAAAPSSLVVLFGHPRLAAEVPGEHLVCAWGGEPLMQEAAAVWLASLAGAGA